MRGRVASWRDAWRALDQRALAARLGAVLFLAGGAGALVLRVAPVGFAGAHTSITVAAIAIVFGAIALRLPWNDWPVDAQLVFPLLGFALLVAAAHDASRTTSATVVAALTLLFLVTGVAQRPGRCLLLAPIAAVAMMLATTAALGTATGADILVGVGAATASGEAMSLVLRRQGRAERRIRALLEAVREMSAVDDRAAAPRCVAELAANLLEAHAVAVLLRVTPSSPRLVSRAHRGPPGVGQLHPERVARQSPSGAPSARHERRCRARRRERLRRQHACVGDLGCRAAARHTRSPRVRLRDRAVESAAQHAVALDARRRRVARGGSQPHVRAARPTGTAHLRGAHRRTHDACEPPHTHPGSRGSCPATQ